MELISKDEAIKQIQKVEQEPNYQHDYEDWRDGLIIAENIVDELPTIEERKEGRNLKANCPSLYKCSECGWECWDTIPCDTETFNFCPNCGAKMERG